MSDRPFVNPALKWAGGKRWLVPRVRDFYDAHRPQVKDRDARLVDPFCGGLSIPLGIRPDNCLISDANPHLMNFYKHLQTGLEWDEDLGIEFENDPITYYDNRNKFNALCASREYWTKEGALLFYYLNRTCFNGLCRFNTSGFFNVPFGKYKNLIYKRDFLQYKNALKEWSIYFGDFASLPLNDTDVVYADPPYDVEFTQFVPRDFTWSDQERLAKWLAGHPGPVMASNTMTPRVVQLYQGLGFEIYQVEGPRAISCTGDRTPADEILACRPKL